MRKMRGTRTRRLRLTLGVAFTVVVAAATMAAISATATKPSAGASEVGGVRAVESLLGAIPQKNLTLGDAGAPVELIEYGDLQCPICKQAAEVELSRVIRAQIADGKAKLTFRNFLIMGPQSLPAGAAAIAAGEQGRGWSFIELFLRNQGEENSGYVSGAFLESIATAAGVEDLARWNEARRSQKVQARVMATSRGAEKLDLTGTPTFAIRGPRTHGLKILGTPGSAAAIERAVREAG
jgi:protein-disulfide isomerase